MIVGTEDGRDLLQRALHDFATLSQSTGFQFSVNKFFFMPLGGGNRKFRYRLGNFPLEERNMMTDLGVLASNELDFLIQFIGISGMQRQREDSKSLNISTGQGLPDRESPGASLLSISTSQLELSTCLRIISVFPEVLGINWFSIFFQLPILHTIVFYPLNSCVSEQFLIIRAFIRMQCIFAR